MSKHCLPILLTSVAFAACKPGKEAAYFTGTISYSYTYSSDSLNADSLSAMRPSRSDFRYDLQDYQSRFTGKDTAVYYYSGKRNKCLEKTNGTENYSCDDYGLVTDSVISWKIYDAGEKVLGYACRILEIQKGNSWVKYHVSRDLRIAPATYEKHRSYNWDLYGEKAEGGLILRSEHRFRHFTMKGEATAVDRKDNAFRALKLDDTLFDQVCN